MWISFPKNTWLNLNLFICYNFFSDPVSFKNVFGVLCAQKTRFSPIKVKIELYRFWFLCILLLLTKNLCFLIINWEQPKRESILLELNHFKKRADNCAKVIIGQTIIRKTILALQKAAYKTNKQNVSPQLIEIKSCCSKFRTERNIYAWAGFFIQSIFADQINSFSQKKF